MALSCKFNSNTECSVEDDSCDLILIQIILHNFSIYNCLWPAYCLPPDACRCSLRGGLEGKSST